MTKESASGQEERKNQILAAAAVVFAQQGVDAARVDDIAQAAGLSKGTVYWYFESKESLTLELLRRILAQQLEQLQQLPSTQGSISEHCFNLLRQFIDDLAQQPYLVPLVLEFYALAARHNDARQLFRDFFQHYNETLAVVITQGIERGEFRPVQVATVINSITALFEGTMILFAFGSLTIPLPQAFEESVQLLFEGLKVHP